MDTVGKRLKAWRKENNLTLTDISAKQVYQLEDYLLMSVMKN